MQAKEEQLTEVNKDGYIHMANNSDPKRRDNYSTGNICNLEDAKRQESRIPNK